MRHLLQFVFFCAAGAVLSCTALPDAPLDHADLGTYVITSFQLPQAQRGAMPWAQRMVGRSIVFGPDRILFPPDFGHGDCQHEGYRLTQRPTNYLPPFDLGDAGTISLAEADIQERDLLEVWNACVNGAYLSVDRGRMYLPGRGALFILERQ